jgi:hypothetical protein
MTEYNSVWWESFTGCKINPILDGNGNVVGGEVHYKGKKIVLEDEDFTPGMVRDFMRTITGRDSIGSGESK